MDTEKLSEQFHVVRIRHDKIDFEPTHTYYFYYIVDNIIDREFIDKEAIQVVSSVNETSRRFHFYGKQAQIWENEFDLADIAIHPNATIQEIALTMVYTDLEEFIETLQEEISTKHLIPHDIYLMYDDESICQQILSKLKI